MASLSTIFSWFETGDIPTEEQFKQTFSSFRHKDTLVPFNEVKGLTEAFQATVSSEVYNNYKDDLQKTINRLAKTDASNLSDLNKALWKAALGIQYIALIDSSPDQQDGNVYIKDQVNAFFQLVHQKIDGFGTIVNGIKQTLSSNDLNLDELQEIVTYIKQNREQIELLQQVIVGTTTDDKINLIGDYSLWGAITRQNQFNDTLYTKIQEFETSIETGKLRHQEKIRANQTITHNLNTYDFVVDAFDTVTMYTLPIKVRRASLNAVDVEFDSPPSNFIQITIRKI